MKGGWKEEQVKDVYTKWSNLLKSSGRDIVFSISAYKFRDWNPEVCQMSRTTGDISAKCNGGAYFDTLARGKRWPNSVMANAEINNQSAQYAGKGYWNNPDMLPLGAQGLSVPEQQATFALWCIMSSPLILGNDPRHMTKAEKEIILNRTAIKIDQDPTEQGKRIVKNGYSEIWAKHLADGSLAVLLLNRNPFENEQITLNLKDIGFSGRAEVKTVYADENLGSFIDHFSRSIEPRSGLFLMITKK
jgi:alpha-galactosidase